MSQTENNRNMESIRTEADGFCFIRTDEGTGRTIVCGPVTAVPTSVFPDISCDDAHRLFSIVYPKFADYTVYADAITELGVTVLTGTDGTAALPAESHLHRILAEMSRYAGGVLAAVGHDGVFDIAAVKSSRLLLLNTIKEEDSYRTLYYIVRIWKELGFKSGIDTIKLSGTEFRDQTFLNKLKLMTGVNALCE